MQNAGNHNDKLIGIQMLRGIAALGVVIYHAGGSVASSQYQGADLIGIATMGLDAGVDLFFVISGFIISLPIFIGKSKSVGQFLFSRLTRVYPMAILTAALYIGIGGGLLSKWPEETLRTFLTSAFLLPSYIDPVPIVLWTLKQEILFYTLFASLFLSRSAGFALLATWGIASFVINSTEFFFAWLFHIKNIEFLAGIVACYAFVHYRPNPRAAIYMTIGGGALFLAVALSEPFLEPSPRVLTVLLALTSAILVVGIAAQPLIASGYFAFLGTASYSVYLIHFFVISAVNKAISIVAPWLPAPLTLTVLVIFATLGGIGYYVALERPLEIWRKRIEFGLFSNRVADDR